MHSIAADFSLLTVTVSAESVNGSTAGARVTWSTTVPPECVVSVTVQFRTSISGSVVRSYTTTSTSETEVIQTGLQCGYYIRVTVTGVASLGTVSSELQLLIVGGEVMACSSLNYESDDYYCNLIVQFCRYTNPRESES